MGRDEGRTHRRGPEDAEPGLDLILEEVETVVDPIGESAALGPAVGIAVAGGPMIQLPPDESAPSLVGTDNTVKGGLLQAGPVAIAGMLVNGAAALVVVAVARLVSSQSYGEIAQLLGLFFILSMPGSAVLVGVVRRVTGLQTTGQGHLVRRWVARVHRICLVGIGVELVLVLALQGWIAHQLRLPDGRGRGPHPHGRRHLDPAQRRPWPAPGPPELPPAGGQPAGRGRRPDGGWCWSWWSAASGWRATPSGVLVSEVVATLHAHWLARRAWTDPATGPVARTRRPASSAATPPEEILARRKLLADVSAAFVGLALLGLLQNIDVILLGRLDHANVGPYAAISVASKALVFGALALGAYLLPEATIRWNEGGHAIRQLGVTLLFLAVPAVAALGIAVVVPEAVPDPGVLGQAQHRVRRPSPRWCWP